MPTYTLLDPCATPDKSLPGEQSATGVQWLISVRRVDYPAAIAWMERRAEAIRAGNAAEAVWLLEHPPLYTAGTSARPSELLDPGRFPVFPTGRGGRYTYHGPGQRVAYVMLDLRRRGSDIRAFVCALEQWIIEALGRLGIQGYRRPGRIGIWVEAGGGKEAKIAAIGVRVRRWVSYHGIAINVAPDLAHFAGIIPCGLASDGVTSLRALGNNAGMADLDAALHASFATALEPPAQE
jgi:lipoyl(octanoyl) transferase